jgi:branched-chain amino acid transport system substrate-binding protein
MVDEIRIGVVATLVGPYAIMGRDGVRGVELALEEVNWKIAGKPIRLFVESSNAIPDSAISRVEKLLDSDKVDFTIAPLSGNEGLAVRDYAKLRPERAFINGIASAQDMTLRDPAANFFNFATNGVQWMAGLGTYAYETLGYRRMITIAEDYSYPHAQIGGFMLEFCRLGGKIVQKFWVHLGKQTYDEIIAAIPQDIDAIFVALGGADSIQFLKQYEATGHRLPLMAGSIAVDQTVLGAEPSPDYLVGVVSAGPIADGNPDPAWQAYVKAYRTRFPDGLPFPSLLAYGYYVNTKAALLGLQAVEADLSNNQARFKQALRELEFDAPTGHIRLDHNRQGIANTFITVVDKTETGIFYNRLVKMIPEVNQTLGIPESEYLKMGAFSRDNPPITTS